MIGRLLPALLVVVMCLTDATFAAPQSYNFRPREDPVSQPFEPIEFGYEVHEPSVPNYYGHNGVVMNSGMRGTYYVWLPNAQLLQVQYVADSKGYVPKMKLINNYQPNYDATPRPFV